tara:strand:- start:34157 stop:35425 length:1269 start_codon:yes stop_codon:yes gene_type:complete
MKPWGASPHFFTYIISGAFMKRFLPLFCFAALTGLTIYHSQTVQAGSWRIGGYTALEARAFTQDHKWPEQNDRMDLSLILTPEFRYKSDERNHRVNFIPYLRGSNVDGERSHADLREAYYMFLGDEIEFLVGANKVFWGVAESQHLVNIINQTDLIEDPDQEDYLGQPMVQIASQRDWGKVTAYVLPYFRERTLTGEDGRLRAALPYDTENDPTFESSAKEWHTDFALRYSHYFGDFDVALSYFSGTSREPTFNITQLGELRPHYGLINQFGAELQYTTESWLWKFEAIGREGMGDKFAAAVGGFEYSFYQLFDSAYDLGLLLEYQYDGRDTNKSPQTIANNDIFAAARLAFNDTQDSEILAGFTIDHETQDSFINLEAETRIGDNYQIELRARFIVGADQGEDLYSFARDDYVQLRLARYF